MIKMRKKKNYFNGTVTRATFYLLSNCNVYGEEEKNAEQISFSSKFGGNIKLDGD